MQVKQRRDKLRAQAARLKEGSAYVDNPMLLADMRQQRALREELAADIDDLQVRRRSPGQGLCRPVCAAQCHTAPLWPRAPALLALTALAARQPCAVWKVWVC